MSPVPSLPRVAGYAFLITAFCSSCTARAASDWQASLTRDTRGNFPDLRPLRASYAFSWNGITAATADIVYRREQDNFVLEGKGRTVGLARLLWRFDVDYRSLANAETLHPIELHQIETARGKRIETQLRFSEDAVTSTRKETKQAPRTKTFDGENLHDLFSAMLYLRSQPLHERNVYRLAVYPANSAYVATVTVSSHERIKVRTGSWNAIKLDLQLQRLNKKGELEPHRKFKRANAWVSDDPDRVLLRVEGQVFVGTVAAEIQSVRFER